MGSAATSGAEPRARPGRVRRPDARGAGARSRASAPTEGGSDGDAARAPLRASVTLLVLTAAVWVVYGSTLHAPFIFDDRTAIVENPSITRLWPPIGSAAARGPLNPPPLAPTARRPLPNLTFALNYRIAGLDPTGYHVVNLALHILSAALLASIVRRTLRLPSFGAPERIAWPLSLATALLWAVHPLNSEAVIYVTQRTELLVGLCYLATLWAALRYWSAGSPTTRTGWGCVAAAACLAGMASKEVMVSAPLTVLLYERTFRVDSWRATRRSWPLYASLAPGWVLLVLLSISGVSGLSDARHQVPLLVWWTTQTKMLLLYLELVVWPWPLSIHYAPAYLRTIEAAWPWVAAVALLATATLAAVWRRPAVRFVAVVVVLVLGPTMVVPLPKMIAAERRMYVALAALAALAIVGSHRTLSARWPSAALRLTLGVAGAAIVGLGAVTVRRAAAYESAVTIWQDAVLRQPDDPMSHYNLGVALFDAERPEDAIRSFEQTLRLEPDHSMALDNLGATLNRLGRPQEAIAPLEEALRVDPNDAVAHNNLGSALIKLGRPGDAIEHLQRALALMRSEPKAIVHVNLGRALAATGRGADAVAHLEQAVRLDPDDADAQASLADALLQGGQADGAVEHYRRALERKPGDDAARNNLAAALLHLGRTPEAIVHLEQVLRARPDHAGAHYNLGRALLGTDRLHDAAEHLRRAAQLDPNDAQVRFDCAVAYARIDRRADAIAMASDGLALARSRGETALAGEIDAWLRSQGGGTGRGARDP